MKVAEANNVVQFGNSYGEESSFQIEMNSKMFSLLSSNIYKDKIGSIVREISCNAYDAHVAAGKSEVPFQIHMPNAFEPWFSVRDMGIGLSEDEIRTVFTVYGKSLKDHSNNFIGAKGLGCKTPFAYRDQFTVISNYDGYKTIYSAVIGQNGVPTILNQSKEPTDECNGIEIIVSVDTNDFNKFEKAVREQLLFFTVKPEIINNNDITFPDITKDILFSGDGYNIYEGKSDLFQRAFSKQIYIVQGGVGYPLDIDLLQNNEIVSFAYKVKENGAALYFDIGEVEVIGSREGIEYNESTIKNIVNRFEKISSDLSHDVWETFNSFSSKWDRMEYFNSISGVVKSALTHSVNFKNIRDNYDYMNYRMIFNVSNSVMSNKDFKFVNFDATGNERLSRSSDFSSIIPNHNTIVIARDTTKRPIVKLNHYYKNHTDGKCKFIVIEGKNSIVDGKSIQEASEILGGVKVLKISELPDPPKELRKTYTNSLGFLPKAWEYNNGSNIYASKDWRPVENIDDIDDDIVFIPVHFHEFQQNIDRILFYIITLPEFSNTRIFALNKKTYQKILDSREKNNDFDNWFTSSEFLESVSEKVDKIKKFHFTYMKWDHIMKIINRENLVRFTHKIIEKGLEDFIHCEKFDYIIRFIKIAEKRMEKYEKHLIDIRFLYDSRFPQLVDNDEFEDLFHDIREKYPMLRFVRFRDYTTDQTDDDFKDVFDYICKMNE